MVALNQHETGRESWHRGWVSWSRLTVSRDDVAATELTRPTPRHRKLVVDLVVLALLVLSTAVFTFGLTLLAVGIVRD